MKVLYLCGGRLSNHNLPIARQKRENSGFLCPGVVKSLYEQTKLSKGTGKNHQPVRRTAADGFAPQLLRPVLQQRSGISDAVFSGDDPVV
jgi:hypothetical protein